MVRTQTRITKRAASLSTIRRTLLLVDLHVLDAVLHAWLAASSEVPKSLRAVAVGGKSCHGVRTGGDSRVHLVSAIDYATGIPLWHVLAEAKGFEIAAIATVLDRIELVGVVVTADALHTQRQHAQYPDRHNGRYVFIAKRNQPKLHDRRADLRGLRCPRRVLSGPQGTW